MFSPISLNKFHAKTYQTHNRLNDGFECLIKFAGESSAYLLVFSRKKEVIILGKYANLISHPEYYSIAYLTSEKVIIAKLCFKNTSRHREEPSDVGFYWWDSDLVYKRPVEDIFRAASGL